MSLKTELWAIQQGLQLILNRSGNFTLETNSSEAFNLLAGTQSASHPFKVLVDNWQVHHHIRSEREINALMASKSKVPRTEVDPAGNHGKGEEVNSGRQVLWMAAPPRL
ncbi:unnamed protein product [Ilex paraguariensis]|uniref:RNase H type-1 domain-containing protein n=1 Tax=Ilex paraguariensis TaxID=185542 RepID=A0ABC8U3I3_9AQUA